jgi:hypothetical protein
MADYGDPFNPLPSHDDPMWREKMAEYHRNLPLRGFPKEMGRIGRQAGNELTDPRHLNRPASPGAFPSWVSLLNNLLMQGARGSMGVAEHNDAITRNKLSGE